LKPKIKSTLLVLFLIAVFLASFAGTYAALTRTSTLSWTLGSDNFTVTATLAVNGGTATPVSDYASIPLGTVQATDTYVIVFTVISGANEPLTVTASASIPGAAATWAPTAQSVTLATNGASATITLTLTAFTASENTVNVNFAASP
jgi:hypothetical protein